MFSQLQKLSQNRLIPEIQQILASRFRLNEVMKIDFIQTQNRHELQQEDFYQQTTGNPPSGRWISGRFGNRPCSPGIRINQEFLLLLIDRAFGRTWSPENWSAMQREYQCPLSETEKELIPFILQILEKPVCSLMEPAKPLGEIPVLTEEGHFGFDTLFSETTDQTFFQIRCTAPGFDWYLDYILPESSVKSLLIETGIHPGDDSFETEPPVFPKPEPMELRVELGTVPMTLDELRQLQPGDIISTEIPRDTPFLISLDGVPAFLGTPGVFQGVPALQISATVPVEKENSLSRFPENISGDQLKGTSGDRNDPPDVYGSSGQ